MESSFHHQVHDALEFEFYVPTCVWDHPATTSFLSEVYALVEGATVLGGAKGVWRGETETTNLVRVLVRRSDVRFSEALPSIQTRVERLMRAWSTDGTMAQESFMFTMRELNIYSTTSVGTNDR